MEIVVGTALTVVEHLYPAFSLRLYPFLCKWTGGSMTIVEHAQAIWVDRSERQDYDSAEADVPIVREFLLMGGGFC
ncbi:hypothetical protein [Sphingobacterium gobiense]|uniref:hypothetical protein n=1 Tax=Sphingobacterium gobiense TaxID=1382456 RepID=UPI0011B0C095|nr:hypothetical protein [Sphingobacterium gobiense]